MKFWMVIWKEESNKKWNDKYCMNILKDKNKKIKKRKSLLLNLKSKITTIQNFTLEYKTKA